MSGLNLLVINVHSCRNAGDAALLKTTIEQLKAHLPIKSVVVSIDDLAVHCGIPFTPVCSLSGWVKPAGKWELSRLLLLIPSTFIPILSFRIFGYPVFKFTHRSLRSLIEGYLNADLVVSKPGGFLYSSGHGLALLISVYEMLLAILSGKPLYILPQSIGPLRYRWEHIMLRFLMSKARIMMVREPISWHEAVKCGIPPHRCKLIPDMAFSFCPDPPTQYAREALARKGIDLNRPLLGITMINWSGQNSEFSSQDQYRYETAVGAAAKWFVDHIGGQVVLFPQVWGPFESQDDRKPARNLKYRLQDLGNSITVIEDMLIPEILKAAYGVMDLFIATRLHSAIFAWSQAIPVIAISYQPKTLGVAQMLGMERWVIDIKEITPDALLETLRELWKERERVKAHLQQQMIHVTQQSRLVGILIAQDIVNLVK